MPEQFPKAVCEKIVYFLQNFEGGGAKWILAKIMQYW
jgi:hypothetical protein